MGKVEQQTQWLSDIYDDLMSVAMRLTQNATKAEDAVSDSVVSALEQIQSDKCQAVEKARFCAWLRTIVRNRCKTRLKRGSHDLPTDIGAKHLRQEVGPDRRLVKAASTDDSDWVSSLYVREETVE
jgi:DNA-directed RNA polymerase specialized sigma24 family protein